MNVILRGLQSKFSAQGPELLVYSFDGFQTGEDIILYSSSPLNMPAWEIQQPNTEYYILGILFWLIQ